MDALTILLGKPMKAKTAKPLPTDDLPRASSEYVKVMRAILAKKNRERRVINRKLEGDK